MSKVPTNLIPTRTLQLPQDPSPSVYGYMAYVRDGVNYRVQVNDVLTINGVPVTRQVIAGTGLYGGGPLSSDVTLGVAPGGIGPTELANTGVTAGTYGSGSTSVQITVDAQGRIDSITTQPIAVTGYVPDTRYVYAGDGLTGGGQLSSNITIDADYSSSTPLSLGGAGAIGISNYLVRGDHQHPAVDLSDDNQVDNILGMDNGGTGNAIVPINGTLVYSGADALYLTPAAGVGQVPYWTGSGFGWASTPLYSSEAANTFWAGPSSGPDNFPTFRLIVPADIPTLNQNTTGTASNVTGIVAAANGGTGQSAYTIGDILYASGSSALSKLADVATGNVLISGGVGAAPSYGKVGLTTHVSGTLPVANGGTGQTSYTDGQLLIGSTAGNTLAKSTLTAGSGVSIANGGGSITISATGLGGTVTSVAQTFTGGLISVSGSPITTSGTLALTVAGTSGGIPYFTGASAWASSGTLAAIRY